MTDYPNYTIWFRGKPACPCLAKWIPAYEAELIRRGAIKEAVDIAQLIGDAPASAGVHASGGCGDIWQTGDVFQLVGREMGAAFFVRMWTGNVHSHFVLNGCPHNTPARYQITALAAGFDGTGYLGRGAPDTGPGPRVLRTWREGIEWAENLQAKEWDEMATEAELRKIIREELDAVLTQRIGNGRTFLTNIALIAEKVGVKPKTDKG